MSPEGDAIRRVLEQASSATTPALVRKLMKDTSFSCDVGASIPLQTIDLQRAIKAAIPTDPYQGIGPGKPLMIVIETVYVGDYPDAIGWIPGFQQGDLLVTSAHKGFHVFDAAPRTVHLLQARVKRRTYPKVRATGQGSQLVYYSPAVADMSILFSVELSADRDVDDELGKKLATAVAAAGALPVFAPAAPFLVAASTAIPIATKAANMLARPRTFFEGHVELNMSRPGVELAQPGALVLYPDGDDDPFHGYKLHRFQLCDVATGEPYRGPTPYVVISLDGAERPELEGWSAQAASAVLLERFFAPDELMSQTLDVATAGLSLYNDMVFRDKAADQLAKAKKATGAAKEQYEAAAAAYAKNIRNEEIRATVKLPESSGAP